MHNKQRLAAIDYARGVFVAWMIVFHAFWDLNFFGLLNINILSDPFWYTQRNIIVFGFIFISGLSSELTSQKRIINFKNEIQIFAAAICVSIGSYLINPKEFIYFGVLHFIFCAKVLSKLLFRSQFKIFICLVLIAISALNIKNNNFNNPYLIWLGIGAKKPVTMDFVPLLTWIGVYCLGQICAWFFKFYTFCTNQMTRTKVLKINQMFLFLGKNSLLIYLIHQPIILLLIKLFQIFSS